MSASDRSGPLSGHVEVDEMYHGPKARGRNGKGKGPSGKAILFGAVERGGDIRVGVVPDSKMSTLGGAITQNVAKGSKISSDDNRSYLGLRFAGYDHQSVNHSAYEWVRGDVHTNTIEGHFRRSILGTHVHVSQKHLWKYASEFAYRRNMRGSHWAMFTRLVVSLSLPRLAET